MLFLGWSGWELGLENQEHELIKRDAKDARRKEGYKKAAETRRKNREAKSRVQLEKEARDRKKRRKN